jgi:hypothetical protein
MEAIRRDKSRRLFPPADYFPDRLKTNLPLDGCRHVQQPANEMFAGENQFSLTHEAEINFDASRCLRGILFRELNSNPIRINADFNRTGKIPLCERRTGFFATS